MTHADPQSVSWGGIAWSQWYDLDRARDVKLIPQSRGLYRFRAQGENGLLYIGESGARWGRLDDLTRARRRHPADYYLKGLGDPGHSSAPYFMLCEDAGCKLEVSWSLDEEPNRDRRRRAEAQLLQLYQEVTGDDPPVQHSGKGVAAYLKRRAQLRDPHVIYRYCGGGGRRAGGQKYPSLKDESGQLPGTQMLVTASPAKQHPDLRGVQQLWRVASTYGSR